MDFISLASVGKKNIDKMNVPPTRMRINKSINSSIRCQKGRGRDHSDCS